MKVQEAHLSQKFLIVVTQPSHNYTITLNGVFEVLWKNSLMDSHVLIEEKTNLWSLYTFIPYQSDCLTLDSLKLATFTPNNFTADINLSEQDLFPEKLNNMNNCPLYIAPSYLDPYIVLLNTTDEHGQPQYSGLEFNIITQISKELNFKIVFKRAAIWTIGAGHGMVFDNGTVTDNLALVIF